MREDTVVLNEAKDNSGDNLELFKEYNRTKDLNLRNSIAEKISVYC